MDDFQYPPLSSNLQWLIHEMVDNKSYYLVDLPMNSMVDLSSSFSLCLPEGINNICDYLVGG